MNDNDELTNIPPMVPDRDDVDSYLSNRKSQKQDIVQSSYYTQQVKVSTWPVRILLFLIIVAMGGAGYVAYFMYGEYENDLRQADLRISDLERRLSLAGNDAAQDALRRIEEIELNFSEIDKLWAARRVINRGLEDMQSEIAKLDLVNKSQDEISNNNSRKIATTNQSVMASDTRLNTLNTELAQAIQLVASLNASVQELEGMRGDILTIRQSLTSGDNTVLGLIGRLEFIEESMESVNAHRLQLNEILFRLQESMEILQRSVSIGPGPSL